MNKLVPDDNVPRVSMQIVQDCLVLSVQVELYDATLMQLRTDLLDNIRSFGVRRAIIDLSGVEVMDPHAYNSICNSAIMAKVMGAKTLISGIRPGVASALVELGVEIRQVETSLNLEDGFKRLAEPVENEHHDLDEILESSDDEDGPAESADMVENGTFGGDGVQDQVNESGRKASETAVDRARIPIR
jgi:rsbT antagonist protein RsbS